MAAEHIAGELIEQDHGGERGQRIGEERVNRQLALLDPQFQEVLADSVVKLGPAVPPLPRLEAEPEFENLGAPVVAHARVSRREIKRPGSGMSMPKSLSSTAQTSSGLPSRRFSLSPPRTWIE